MAGMGYVLDDYNFHHAVAVMRNQIKKKKNQNIITIYPMTVIFISNDYVECLSFKLMQ
jgi:hypothetical protein